MKQALVLGGGGVVGIAWETGIVAGLLDGGVDLRNAEAIVGTSAGSIIGTRLAAGHDLRVAEARTRVPIPPAEASAKAAPDMDVLGKVFGRWRTIQRVDDGFLRDIGALAAEAPQHVVVIAPICAGTAGFGELAERCLDDEIEMLRSVGCRVTRILPLSAEKAAFGPNLMDPERAGPAQAAGYARARALADELTQYWQ